MKHRVGIRIKTLRQNRSLSQADLAEEVGRTVHAISGIERGKSLPNFETLERLADVLKVPVREFFDLDTENQSIKAAALTADIVDMLREMKDPELETARDLIKALAGKSQN